MKSLQLPKMSTAKPKYHMQKPDKVIAWHISSRSDAELVITTFKKAYKKRNTPYGLMFHSDRISHSIVDKPNALN